MDTVVLAMFITTLFVYVVTHFAKPNTNIQQIDHFITYVQSQGTHIPYAAIFVGLMFLLTEEVADRWELFQ